MPATVAESITRRGCGRAQPAAASAVSSARFDSFRRDLYPQGATHPARLAARSDAEPQMFLQRRYCHLRSAAAKHRGGPRDPAGLITPLEFRERHRGQFVASDRTWQHLAEHILQDAAVLVVCDLEGRVDP